MLGLDGKELVGRHFEQLHTLLSVVLPELVALFVSGRFRAHSIDQLSVAVGELEHAVLERNSDAFSRPS